MHSPARLKEAIVITNLKLNRTEIILGRLHDFIKGRKAIPFHLLTDSFVTTILKLKKKSFHWALSCIVAKDAVSVRLLNNITDLVVSPGNTHLSNLGQCKSIISVRL